MPQPLSRPDAPSARSLRILIVAGHPGERAGYQEILRALGHQACAAESADQAAGLCRETGPDLVLTDARLPDGCGYRLAAALGADRPVPVVVVAAEPDPDAVWVQPTPHVLACVGKPVRPAELAAAVAVAARCFDRVRELEAEVAALRQAADDRKLIERAKGRAMAFCRLDEEAAYTRLRQLASDRNERLVEIARSVLAAAEVFAGLAGSGAEANGSAGSHSHGTRMTRMTRVCTDQTEQI